MGKGQFRPATKVSAVIRAPQHHCTEGGQTVQGPQRRGKYTVELHRIISKFYVSSTVHLVQDKYLNILLDPKFFFGILFPVPFN